MVPTSASAMVGGRQPAALLLDQVGPEARTEARRALTDTLRGYEATGEVWLRSSSWLVTATRAESGGTPDRS